MVKLRYYLAAAVAGVGLFVHGLYSIKKLDNSLPKNPIRPEVSRLEKEIQFPSQAELIKMNEAQIAAVSARVESNRAIYVNYINEHKEELSKQVTLPNRDRRYAHVAESVLGLFLFYGAAFLRVQSLPRKQ